ACDEQLSGFIHEAEIASAKPGFVFPLDARLECRSGCVRIVPIALADMRSAHPHLADAVGFEPPPGFWIDDRDALADDISAAADHTMGIFPDGGSSYLMALKRVAADGACDRPCGSASSRIQHSTFG